MYGHVNRPHPLIPALAAAAGNFPLATTRTELTPQDPQVSPATRTTVRNNAWNRSDAAYLAKNRVSESER
jgi:hypothetical protein